MGAWEGTSLLDFGKVLVLNTDITILKERLRESIVLQKDDSTQRFIQLDTNE